MISFLKKFDKRFYKYIIIGFSGLFLDMLLFLLLTKVFKVNHLIANYFSMSVGIVNNFFLNAFFNFKKKDNLFKRLSIFYGIGLIGIAISELFIFLTHDILIETYLKTQILNIIGEELYKYELPLIKFISIVIIAIIQFFLHRKFTFAQINQTNKNINLQVERK